MGNGEVISTFTFNGGEMGFFHGKQKNGKPFCLEPKWDADSAKPITLGFVWTMPEYAFFEAVFECQDLEKISILTQDCHPIQKSALERQTRIPSRASALKGYRKFQSFRRMTRGRSRAAALDLGSDEIRRSTKGSDLVSVSGDDLPPLSVKKGSQIRSKKRKSKRKSLGKKRKRRKSNPKVDCWR